MDILERLTYILDEVKRKRVIRDKKRKRKIVCRSGYKAQDGKCVKMSASEKRSRSKGAKRGSRKKKGSKTSIERKRQRSLKRK